MAQSTRPKAFKKVPVPADLAEQDIPLTDNARTVLERRYLRRGPDGKPVETEQEMFWRVAYHVAQAEETLGGDEAQVEKWARKFFDLLTNLRFFPNSPTFTGAGTPLGQLAACFVLAIEDDMGRTGSGIFETLRHAALIQQTGGGNGFSFSRLRPSGAVVRSSNGTATGPIGFLRVYDQAFGEIAQGGCLVPETLVFTAEGLLRLDEIVTHQEPGWRAHRLTVATDDGPRLSPQTYNNGVVPVLRVETDAGLHLTGTPNHKVKVMTPEGSAWRALEDLKAGDAILVQLGQHQGRPQTLVHPTREHGNQIMPSLPATLDEELAFFLGYLAGDGFVASGDHDHRVGVSVAHDSYLLDEMPALLGRLFGTHLTIHRQQKENDASVTFVIDNRAVKDFLSLNGLAKAASRDVTVPRLVRQSPPAIVGAFLRGLFEADGTVTHGYPQLLSSSERLIQEVATLLIGLGCPVRIHQLPKSDQRFGQADLWAVRIHSFVGLRHWQTRIGCDARSRFAICATFEPDLRHTATHRQVQSSLNDGHPMLQTVEAVAEHAPPVDDRWFVTVESVQEAGEQLTLDLEVEDNHTYLAYGLVTHNTRRGANMAVLRVDHPDIRDFITCKAEEGQIENFNISVGITDAFMQAVINDEEYDLINPQDGSVWERVQAREIFDLIVQYAHHNGEPGVLFLDAANRENPVPHLYELEATNPCVTGDTLIYTAEGMRRADELAAEQQPGAVVVDGRFDVDTLQPSTQVFSTGTKDVYRITTREGYELRLTANHKVMTPAGWVEAADLKPDDEVFILNRKGAFGTEGSEELGLVLGWLVGDGTVNQVRAVLSFFGAEKAEIAPMMAEAVTSLVDTDRTYSSHPSRHYPVGLTEIQARDEVRIQSDRLRLLAVEYGLDEKKLHVPDVIFKGTEATQRAFLQALFTADGTVLDGGDKGGSVRLTSVSDTLLQEVQRVLLNFGIASRIYRERRPGGMRQLPDGQGGYAEYYCQAYHELAISKDNLFRFAQEIGFLSDAKQSALLDYLGRLTRGPYRERFTARVASVEYDGQEEVYDLTQPTTHSFIANGFVVHNCGEQWLGPFENCCLGSVNLAQHYTPDGKVDWPKLQESIELATRFLDDVVTANAYVPAIPELREAAERVRRIGLGIMGLADLMYALGVRYGSREGQEFASQVMEFVRYHAMQTSIKLAKERGPLLAIEGSRYDPNNLQWQPPKPIVEHTTNWGRPVVDWDKVRKGILKHGIRNGAQLTIAPTGTIATVTGCEGYGCEPVFALAYVRYVNENAGNADKQIELQYTSPLFEKALRQAGLDEDTIQDVIAQVNAKGTCQGIEALPESIRHTFVVASDITVEEHIRMQAALQAHVDNAISKTINAPAEATVNDVAAAYKLGWELGCKGLTVYVTGSRQKVVLETAETKASKEDQGAEESAPAGDLVEASQEDAPYIFNYEKKPRPRRLTGFTYRTPTPAGTAYITINENGHGEGQPFEVFMHTEKAGSETAAVSEAMGRLMSLILRLSSPVSPRSRVKQIERQLRGIGGGRQLGFGPNRVSSLPDGVAQILRDYLLDTEREDEDSPIISKSLKTPLPNADADAGQGMAIGDLCPECGQAAYVREEGCRRCHNCGFSEC